MVDSAPETMESRLRDMAAQLAYPATPNIARAERQRLAAGQAPVVITGQPARLLAGFVAALVLLLVVALAVPQTRAALVAIFDIGAIRIVADEEGPATAGRLLLNIAGEMTLSEAANLVDYAILLPAYPADLGQPDRVFVQELAEPGAEQPVVILLWLDPARPDEARLSLYHIAVPFYGVKQAALEVVGESQVNGLPALWVAGPHQLQLQSGDYAGRLLVPGNVLIWSDGQMTYRLESRLTLEQSVRIAESLGR